MDWIVRIVMELRRDLSGRGPVDAVSVVVPDNTWSVRTMPHAVASTPPPKLISRPAQGQRHVVNFRNALNEADLDPMPGR